MKSYIGTKVVQAVVAWKEDDKGKAIKGYKVVYPDGYVSWSPKSAFENSYRRVSTEEQQFMKNAM